MESVKSDRDSVARPRRKSGKPAEAKDSRTARTNPRSRSINRSARASDFAAFADDLRRDLDPRGPLERLMADHVVHSAWRLKGTLDRQNGRESRETRSIPSSKKPRIVPPRRSTARDSP